MSITRWYDDIKLKELVTSAHKMTRFSKRVIWYEMIPQHQFAPPLVCAIQQSWGSFYSGGEMCSLERIASLTPKLCAYDAVSDLMHNWVPQRPDFKSALRVVKMVLNTQCYQYLWLSMWFHAKKSKETLKNSKSLILQCKFGSRAQKWPKIAQKTDH